MKGKLVFGAGVAVGYLVGTKQGRQGYEQLKGSAQAMWQNPTVQEQVETAKQFAREQAPVARELLLDAAHKVAEKAPVSNAQA
jgi:oxygen-dependent protoporphyrinogen oxidase